MTHEQEADMICRQHRLPNFVRPILAEMFDRLFSMGKAQGEYNERSRCIEIIQKAPSHWLPEDIVAAIQRGVTNVSQVEEANRETKLEDPGPDPCQ
jgi:hypothetical protein